MADRRFCPLIPEAERVRASEGMQAVAGRQHQNCVDVCAERGMLCGRNDFWWLNTCSGGRAGLPYSICLGRQSSGDLLKGCRDEGLQSPGPCWGLGTVPRGRLPGDSPSPPPGAPQPGPAAASACYDCSLASPCSAAQALSLRAWLHCGAGSRCARLRGRRQPDAVPVLPHHAGKVQRGAGWVCEAQCRRVSVNQEGRQSRHQTLQPSWLRVVQGGPMLRCADMCNVPATLPCLLQKASTCSAKHAATARLCPCVPLPADKRRQTLQHRERIQDSAG